MQPTLTADAIWSDVFKFVCGIMLGWLLKVLADRWSLNRQFDHRLKLEKEYKIYLGLWQKLFELRRTVGNLIEGGPPGFEEQAEEVRQAFNVYQAVIRKHEPFMSESVYEPARGITRLVREILNNAGKIEKIDNNRRPGITHEEDERLAEKQIELAEESDARFEDIETLFQAVSSAISSRVRKG
jgi:hypothetical protein